MQDPAKRPVDQRQSHAWQSFNPGRWEVAIDVRDFIVRNFVAYEGDETFLVGPSPRTKAVWEKLQPYFQEERNKGVLDVDATTPSAMLAHAAGLIDRDNEVIVGLQTDKPFRRAIFPFGGPYDALVTKAAIHERCPVRRHRTLA
jgi:formate C-acetyltransferase